MSVYASVKFYSLMNSLLSKLVSNAFAIMSTHSLYIYLMYCNLMIWGCFFKMANTHVLFFVKMDFSLLCLLFSFLVFLILLIALYILRNIFYFLYVLHDENNDNFHFIISLITQSPGNMFYRCFSSVLIV